MTMEGSVPEYRRSWEMCDWWKFHLLLNDLGPAKFQRHSLADFINEVRAYQAAFVRE